MVARRNELLIDRDAVGGEGVTLDVRQGGVRCAIARWFDRIAATAQCRGIGRLC